MLQLFISWMPSAKPGKPDFVLTRPDFNFQNILVGSNGSLKSLIDWDGIAAHPICIGNDRYPSWLTCDWDPAKYAYSTGLSIV